VIYCVVPQELEDELYEQLTKYYADNPNVSVIIDRREGPNRRQGEPSPEIAEQRQTRDRRRKRAAGTFPKTDLPE
jgi:hypothetical protein